ncbi:LysR family transcriptional regulator [Nitratireductor sp. XY-223]|uniref:LysR family transcriptional regulator n=1 Tax=Nitratireductor sp. XY-223 TaxID=2561926 RepID=UPI0010AA839D|nr:LysR family transcriptional regulator [Nitratireductor sp. XY-223]
MSDIDQTKLRKIDLTLLLVFLGLMRHRKAVSVAGELGLTQSSISHSLRRLREIFADPLFLRRAHGLEPTAVANALEPNVRHVVETLNNTLAAPDTFEPNNSTRVIRIAGRDNILSRLVPPLVARLGISAPRMRLSSLELGRDAAMRAVSDGDIDFAIGYYWDYGKDLLSDTLYTEEYRVIARKGHPLFCGDLTVESYAGARHILVSEVGDMTGIVDMTLEKIGMSRRVVASVPLFFPALATVAQSDLIGTLPKSLVEEFAPLFGLAWRAPPIEIRTFTIQALRHRRDEKNPFHTWLLGVLMQCARIDRTPLLERPVAPPA